MNYLREQIYEMLLIQERGQLIGNKTDSESTHISQGPDAWSSNQWPPYRCMPMPPAARSPYSTQDCCRPPGLLHNVLTLSNQTCAPQGVNKKLLFLPYISDRLFCYCSRIGLL